MRKFQPSVSGEVDTNLKSIPHSPTSTMCWLMMIYINYIYFYCRLLEIIRSFSYASNNFDCYSDKVSDDWPQTNLQSISLDFDNSLINFVLLIVIIIDFVEYFWYLHHNEYFPHLFAT